MGQVSSRLHNSIFRKITSPGVPVPVIDNILSQVNARELDRQQISCGCGRVLRRFLHGGAPAVDGQGGAGDKRRLVGSQKQAGLRHLFRFSKTPQRISLQKFCHQGGILAQLFGHFGFDHAGAEGVGADALRPILHGDGFAELVERAFGGVVGGGLGNGDHPQDGTDVDDTARTLLDHVRQHLSGQLENSGHVDVEYPVPFPAIGFVKRTAGEGPGVVDENIHLAQFLQGGSDQPFDILLAGDIALNGQDRIADFLLGLIEPVLTPAENGDPRAFLGEQAGAGQADAGGASGDDGGFVIQSHAESFLSG